MMRASSTPMSAFTFFREYNANQRQTARSACVASHQLRTQTHTSYKGVAMSGDDLRAHILHTFEAIVSTLKHWFEAISSRFSHHEHDREYIRTVPGSTVVRETDQQHVIDLFGESIH